MYRAFARARPSAIQPDAGGAPGATVDRPPAREPCSLLDAESAPPAASRGKRKSVKPRAIASLLAKPVCLAGLGTSAKYYLHWCQSITCNNVSEKYLIPD
jgi:hypothetical protein